MKLSVQTYKVSDGVPATPKNVSQQFTPFAEPVYSTLDRWKGKDGNYKEDGHKFKELCKKCGRAFGDHYHNQCY
jgi:hypothetical protein